MYTFTLRTGGQVAVRKEVRTWPRGGLWNRFLETQAVLHKVINKLKRFV